VAGIAGIIAAGVIGPALGYWVGVLSDRRRFS
jgi:purine-cytosine permease-like protein